MKKIWLGILIIFALLLSGCSNPFIAKKDGIESLKEVDFNGGYGFIEIDKITFKRDMAGFSLLKENETGVYFLARTSYNYQVGMTPLLNKKGETVTDKNITKEDLYFENDRFYYAKEMYEVFEGGTMRVIIDSVTGKIYYTFVNFQGDGSSITSAY